MSLFTEEQLRVIAKNAPEGTTHVGADEGQHLVYFLLDLGRGTYSYYQQETSNWSAPESTLRIQHIYHLLQKLPPASRSLDRYGEVLEVGDLVTPVANNSSYVKVGEKYTISYVREGDGGIKLYGVGTTKGYPIRFCPSNFKKVKSTPIDFTQEEYDELHDELALKDDLIGDLQKELETIKNTVVICKFKLGNGAKCCVERTIEELLTEGEIKWTY